VPWLSNLIYGYANIIHIQIKCESVVVMININELMRRVHMLMRALVGDRGGSNVERAAAIVFAFGETTPVLCLSICHLLGARRARGPGCRTPWGFASASPCREPQLHPRLALCSADE
jgi:hypothetical protein